MDRADLDAAVAALARLDDPELDPASRLELERAVTTAARRIKQRAKARRSAQSRDADRTLLAGASRFRTEIPSPEPVAPAAPAETLGVLRRVRLCYVCKGDYREVDADYHQMCPVCAAENRDWRHARTDLTGRTAIITGGRVKIGFHTALKLLRDGATVVATTRFPDDAAQRFAALSDFDQWGDRLHLHGLDLLDLDALQEFVRFAGRRFDHLDILVNNAAQTVYRPPAYYRSLGTAPELQALDQRFFPAGRVDETGFQLDLRPVNSWVLRDGEVSPHEWLSAHVVNAFAPFLLTSRLRPLLAAGPPRDRHVVQVSAMEGSFSRTGKTVRHPHTNMAKASLNMLVRTSAPDYARERILMNAVDTGWVTDERPHPHKQEQRAIGFRPPLDVIDGAARVYHPVVAAGRGAPISGKFLKDYRSVPW
ncbi:hypothetical protein ACWT_4364 [Actinoplanes sp. SE50]|uniref:SDR family NAD(P)-dependent oxidoreductase n=1 Tax=unclassified Actinoplanes TaxID=2626549 RepID=UPI00023EC9A6|nr:MULTISPECIES: SDR family oxidoreductase [unclassified Actinoplanes]AEV85384.1 uncharacterized protein ACPL_4493 [Actinoplanes sp. SE50/110]ATO83779.1 hypothetical protein ACWT_4364 [Actinoplanes sp. SE50]SLM01187.1 hypothetical protein ACSP50_4420 [Actinoplanes sp. SE50/110]